MKKLNKKLVINKETIANLNNEQQFQVLGGGIAQTNDCVGIHTDSCPTNSCQPSCGDSCVTNVSCRSIQVKSCAIEISTNACIPTV